MTVNTTKSEIVHLRTLEVGKYTPNTAVMGDTGLFPPFIEQWCCITRTWCKNVNMDSNRLNKKIFLWAHRFAMAG